MKKICKITVVCILLCSLILPISVHAMERVELMEPKMTNISVYRTELSISRTGIASISGFVRGKSGVTNTYVKVTLQKRILGTWVDVESWENSSNTRSTYVDETYQVSRGTYRVNMTCSADGETKTAISEERTY